VDFVDALATVRIPALRFSMGRQCSFSQMPGEAGRLSIPENRDCQATASDPSRRGFA
jgi:hypothetical protein